MAKKPRKASRSAQLARRKLEQKRRKIAADRDRLFALSPGGSARQPIGIASPAVIESKARALPCPQCGGALVVDEHSARVREGQSLRLISAHCTTCGEARNIWFRIEEPVSN
jgi:predicted RNA-binding Zn-ribbon protein involved in translation (DUF1610 family)